MRISDWSSDVCSSDLTLAGVCRRPGGSALRGRVSFDPLPALLRRHPVPLLAQFAAVFLRHAAHLVEQRACLFPLFGVHVPPALHAAVRSLALFRGHVLPSLRFPVHSPALFGVVVPPRTLCPRPPFAHRPLSLFPGR